MPRARPPEVFNASTSARLSAPWQVPCTITLRSKPRKSRNAQSLSFGASVTQPLFGALADRVGPRLVAGGVAIGGALSAVAKVPVIYAASGNCHVYVDASADLDSAREIVVNAKVQRPGVCNAAETLLVHRDVPFLPRLLAQQQGGHVVNTASMAGLAGMPGVWTNRHITAVKDIPQRLIVLGGGPSGVELAQAFARMGSSVVLVEGADRAIARADAQGLAASCSAYVTVVDASAPEISFSAP